MMTATMENKTEILTKLSENEELKNALKKIEEIGTDKLSDVLLPLEKDIQKKSPEWLNKSKKSLFTVANIGCGIASSIVKDPKAKAILVAASSLLTIEITTIDKLEKRKQELQKEEENETTEGNSSLKERLKNQEEKNKSVVADIIKNKQR